MDEKLVLTKRPNDEVVLMEVLSKAKKEKSSEDNHQNSEEFTAAQAYLISKNHSKNSAKKNAQWLELP